VTKKRCLFTFSTIFCTISIEIQAAPGYQLPPGAVVSADLKLRDLVLLDDAILKRKLNFNKRFNQLRDAKRAIAVSVTQVSVGCCRRLFFCWNVVHVRHARFESFSLRSIIYV